MRRGARAGTPGAGHAAPPDPARAEFVLSKLQLLITRRLDGLLQGDYLGLLPGPGSEAGEAREYRAGDDVRRMDWPVTARTTVPHVRQTIADRELETWLALDLSASLDFGTATCLKRDLAIAAAAAIAHLTVRGGNRIGAVVGTGDAVRRIHAHQGRKGAQALLRSVALTPPAAGGGRTDLAALIDSLNRPVRRRGLAVVISDFLADSAWERPMRKLAVRHDVLAVEVVDPRELELTGVGVMEFADPETGAVHEIDTSDAKLRAAYAEQAAAQRAQIARGLRRAGVPQLRLRTDSDWLIDIVRFVAGQRHARTRGTTR
ncbi:MAG: DUF58 domain-containing protein [Micromonosporaceae bacterium]